MGQLMDKNGFLEEDVVIGIMRVMVDAVSMSFAFCSIILSA